MNDMRCANVIVLGHTGAGKSSFINYLVGHNLMVTGNGKPVTQNFDCYLDRNAFGLPVRLFDSKGFEVGEYKQIADDTIKFINDKCNKDDVYEWIHTVFYCINRTKARVDDSEISLIRRIQSETLRTPHIVLTNCDGSEQDEKMKEYILKTFGSGVQIYTVSSVAEKTRRGTTTQFGRDAIIESIFATLWFDMLRVTAKTTAKLFYENFQNNIQDFTSLLNAKLKPEEYDEQTFKNVAVEILGKRIENIKVYNKSIGIITTNSMNDYVAFLNQYAKTAKFSIDKTAVNVVIENVSTSLLNAANSIDNLYIKKENPLSIFIGDMVLDISFLLRFGVAGAVLWGVGKLLDSDSESDKKRRAHNRAVEEVVNHVKSIFPTETALEKTLLEKMDSDNQLGKYFPKIKTALDNMENSTISPVKEEVFPKTVIHNYGNRADATTVISNKCGVHARPASIMVQTATKFKSKVFLKAKGKRVDAKSILMPMSMGLVKGTEVTFEAEGPDAYEAVTALAELIDNKFGEE